MQWKEACIWTRRERCALCVFAAESFLTPGNRKTIDSRFGDWAILTFEDANAVQVLLHTLKLMIIHKIYLFYRKVLWLVRIEEKKDQERRREPIRWNKARTCSLVWSVIYLNLLWDSSRGCTSLCVSLYSPYIFTSPLVLLWMCLFVRIVVVKHPSSSHSSHRGCLFFVWGDTKPTWIYLQRNLYELWWTCLDRQLQAAQQRATIKTLLNCINKYGEAKVDRQCSPALSDL